VSSSFKSLKFSCSHAQIKLAIISPTEVLWNPLATHIFMHLLSLVYASRSNLLGFSGCRRIQHKSKRYGRICTWPRLLTWHSRAVNFVSNSYNLWNSNASNMRMQRCLVNYMHIFNCRTNGKVRVFFLENWFEQQTDLYLLFWATVFLLHQIWSILYMSSCLLVPFQGPPLKTSHHLKKEICRFCVVRGGAEELLKTKKIMSWRIS